jgi:glutamine synthetase
MNELKSAVIDFSKRSTNGMMIVEYIWIGGNDLDIRSKCMVISEMTEFEDLPVWNYDGSSTNQALGHDSEILIVPRKAYPDPFRLDNHLLVLCDTWYPDGTRTDSNFRALCQDVLKGCESEQVMFGVEQQYIFYRKFQNWPLGFPVGGYPKPQGPYYCGVGADVNVGRRIVDTHNRACLYAGLNISGMNAEVMPGQWEFQIGPCQGIDIGDQLWMARYLLLRSAELYGINVSWDPKPVASDEWNGSGGLFNYSTKSSRAEGGINSLLTYIKKLETHHLKFIEMSGIGNQKRLNGKNESSDWHFFSFGIADRMASVRIPKRIEQLRKGYIEDRRPAANMDPYLISAAITDITLKDGLHLGQISEQYQRFQKKLNR